MTYSLKSPPYDGNFEITPEMIEASRDLPTLEQRRLESDAKYIKQLQSEWLQKYYGLKPVPGRLVQRPRGPAKMTVAELIAKLLTMPQDMPVVVEDENYLRGFVIGAEAGERAVFIDIKGPFADGVARDET